MKIITIGVAVVDDTNVVFMSNFIFQTSDSSGKFLTRGSKIELCIEVQPIEYFGSMYF